MDWDSIQALGLALGLGLLVGMQRQRVEKRLAGIRTFPLITVFGTICALLGRHSDMMVPLGLLAVVVLIAIENLHQRNLQDGKGGLTTEAALLLMFVIGAYLVDGERAVALAVTGVVLVLLYAKQPMHRFVQQLAEGDISAIVQFVIISLIILPILPDHAYGPYQVLNPFEIWLMVVLIVGLSLFGYVAYKFFSTRSGTLISGLLGGLVSSTATTASYARQAAGGYVRAPLAALVIAIASTVVFVRILIEMAVVAPRFWDAMAAPLGVLLAVATLISVVAYLRMTNEASETPKLGNPAELKPAVVFGVLYAIVIFLVAAVKDLFGEGGLYIVGIVSGLTDVDAITLSTAQLVNSGRLEIDIGWRVIVSAALANLAFKSGIAAFLGGSVLCRRVLLLFSPTFLAGALILWLW